MDGDFNTRVKDYWEQPGTISIIDKNLHELEIDMVLRYLEPTDRVADIGCGDGEATARYAIKVRHVVGIERSAALRARATASATAAGRTNVEIRDGDVMALAEPRGAYDAVVSQRLLINLGSWEEQQRAIVNIHRILRPGGRLVLVENTNEAFQAMNDMRHKVGLAPVPQHWHNRFFDHGQLMNFMEGKFQLLRHLDFGLYYFLTRVYTPMFASFVGYGANAVKDPIFEHSDAAARQVHELFADRLRVAGVTAFGPIQVFIFRREGPDL